MRTTGALTRRGGATLAGPVNLAVEGRGVTAVIGPNGAGKTSLLRMLHGLAPLHAGRIVWACPEGEARRRQAFVFQRPVMLRRSAVANVAFPLRLLGLGRREAFARAAALVERVGLGPAADRPAWSLSGGEGQKLALARALVRRPELLFLDEPTASLDGRATREVEAILADAAAAGTRIVFATHDLGQVRRLADEVWFLLRGRVHEAGSADRILAAPATPEMRAFLRGDIVE